MSRFDGVIGKLARAVCSALEKEMRKVLRIELKPRVMVSEVDDEVALDEPICIFVNGDYHVTLIATPTMQKELAVGYLFGEGVIDSVDDVKSIELEGTDVHVTLKYEVDLREAAVSMMNLIVTACASSPRRASGRIGVPKVESDLNVDAETILRMVADLSSRSSIHPKTGGTHAAMLCSEDGKMLAFAEDVGRHNAVDKVIGAMVLRGRDLRKCVLTSTGRQSGEMVHKVARAGIPVVASMTAPLSSGIRLAEMAGITLICFARGRRLQIYSNPQRIVA